MYPSCCTCAVLHVALQIILEHTCAEYGSQHQDQAPVLLLHGFDSSSLEFRRLLPLLERSLEAWAVDLVGWGFTDSGAATQSNMKLGPKQKRDHLYAFWKEKVKISTCCRFVLEAWFTLRDKLNMTGCLCRPALNSVFCRIVDLLSTKQPHLLPSVYWIRHQVLA